MGIAEIRMIEDVERLKAEFSFDPFSDGDVPEN
jgi:hypothetical protein